VKRVVFEVQDAIEQIRADRFGCEASAALCFNTEPLCTFDYVEILLAFQLSKGFHFVTLAGE
jgi:hypothetical protein